MIYAIMVMAIAACVVGIVSQRAQIASLEHERNDWRTLALRHMEADCIALDPSEDRP